MLEAERAGAKALVVYMDDRSRATRRRLEGAARDPGRRGAQLRADRQAAREGRRALQPRHRQVLRQGGRRQGRARADRVPGARPEVGGEASSSRPCPGSTRDARDLFTRMRDSHLRSIAACESHGRQAACRMKLAAPQVDAREARRRQHAAALAAEARALRALRHRVAGAVVRPGARSASSWPNERRRRLAQAQATAKPTARCAASGRRCSSAELGAGAAGRDPLRQQHRPRPALARRDARRRAGGADLARLLADVEGLRQAEGDLRAAAARAWCTPPTRRSSARRSRRSARSRRSVAELLEANPGSTLEREFSKVTPETIAKILFTSGSTGMPKGVINTHAHAVREPADDGAGLAVRRGAAAGGGRLAAVEPHLRRQPQLQHGAAQRRHALHRRRQAGARA